MKMPAEIQLSLLKKYVIPNYQMFNPFFYAGRRYLSLFVLSDH
jgi:hypothetical protein